jgi:hypothetical protein
MFYEKGRFGRLPATRRVVGHIAKLYPERGVVSVALECDGLRVGGRLGYLLPSGVLEEEITSLQHDRRDIDSGKLGQRVGLKTTFSKTQLREKLIVYEVSSE